MTRRLRRHKDFDVTVEIKNDGFIRPPRDAQRNWLLKRALAEFVWDLEDLDALARGFVSGSSEPQLADRTQAILDQQEIMEDWQVPIMRAMADVATEQQGDVLEIGFGRGVASEFIQDGSPRSHTVVECNDAIVDNFAQWRRSHADSDIRLIHGRWQDTVGQFEQYDAIFFHTYPLNEEEFVDYVSTSVTFAEHFFDTAAAHLRDGGVFTYLTNEANSLSRQHQRLIFDRFRSFKLSKVAVNPPADSKDDLWADSMVVIGAYK